MTIEELAEKLEQTNKALLIVSETISEVIRCAGASIPLEGDVLEAERTMQTAVRELWG